MVHTFKALDNYFIIDTESGSVFCADEAAHLAVLKMLGNPLPKTTVTLEQIDSAKGEIERLIADGYLFSKPSQTAMPKSTGVIKSICLNICHDCNLRCKYCFADEGAYGGQRARIDSATARAAVDFLIQKSGHIKNLEMDFFGGEPTLNFDVVKDTVAYAKKRAKEFGKAFRFTLTTNAQKLSDEDIDFINAEMDNVVISLDGRKEVHDNARPNAGGGGTFETAVKNAKRLIARRGDKEYFIRGTFTSHNLDFSKDVLYLNDLGFDSLSIEPVVLPRGHDMAIKEEHLAQIFDEYDKLAKAYTQREREGRPFNFFHFNVDFEGGPCERKRLSACGAGNEYVAVVPGGDIYPCHQFVGNPAYKMGNVITDTSVNQDIAQKLYNCNVTTKKECAQCFAKYYCSGGCMANSAQLEGDINKPNNISCQIMRKRTECAIALNALKKMKVK